MSSVPYLKKRLGDLLVDDNLISESQLHLALEEQQKTGRKLGTILQDMRLVTESELLPFLAQQLRLPFLDMNQMRLDMELVQKLPEVHARHYRAILLEDRGHSYLVGLSDPTNLNAIDQLGDLLQPKELDFAVVSDKQLAEAFDNVYRRTKDIESFATQLKQEYAAGDEFNLNALTAETETDSTIVRMLQTIFEDAIQMRASDIHIEPDEQLIRIRQRIDGVLQENILQEVSIAPALILRLKLMANLDIAEKRIPQDGRFQIRVRGYSIDVRLSTLPTYYGEAAVMRLLNQTAGLLTLEQTGMPAPLVKHIRQLINSPHGMFVVTGPTGSGKTTTLYSVLSELNQEGVKIITAEDPVEYRLSRINQVQINHKVGLTFSTVLRTALRQDPDVIMVGEMRDQETAEIGLRGALTGHLVLSTLHTNDAVSSTLRLIDMGTAPYLVASSLRAILAQRLIKRICDQCKTPYKLTEFEHSWVAHSKLPPDAQFWHGRGCQACNYTGYRGRIGVFELLVLNKPLADALRRGDNEGFSKLAYSSDDFFTLGDMALDYAQQGIVPLSEAIRVSEHIVTE